ncbi:MAG: endonuclease/exonuclease/phosphatase family protein [Deltaproteobacteria bacterium]|nr:endonuclease/exonuclease/phosphatase family protein [Deltaproteobacteria bacterium]
MRVFPMLVIFAQLALAACSSLQTPQRDASPSDAPRLADLAVGDAPSTDTAPLPTGPAIDGVFAEWDGVARTTDPAGDNTKDIDLLAVQAMRVGDRLMVAFEIATAVNAHAGRAGDGSLLFEIKSAKRALTLDLRARTLLRDNDPQQALRWSAVGYLIAPTYAAKRFEFSLKLNELQLAADEAPTITISGSDTLAAPLTVTHRQSPDAAALRPITRQRASDLRIASLNTWFDGLTSAARGAAARRLVKAVAANIYCFQEAFQGTANTIANALQTADPHADGAAWNVHHAGDLVIAAREQLLPLPTGNQPFVGAALRIDSRPLVVYTTRPACCGYAGNGPDLERLSAMKLLAESIAALRQGKVGSELVAFKDAPVIVVGDFNLVGSRAPLDALLSASQARLSHWPLTHLDRGENYTWRGLDKEDYPPGTLDYLLHDSALTRRNGFILQTDRLDATTLNASGLQAADSQAADHLLLVGDFAWP